MVKETHTDKGLRKAQRIVNPVQRRLYPLKDAAEYLGRTVWGVRELVWSGKIPVVKDGRKQYLDIRDLDLYIERNKMTIV